MKDILTAYFDEEIKNITANMYRLGWHERNSGNISWLLDEKDVAECLDLSHILRTIPIAFDASALAGEYFLVTGAGKFFKDIELRPDECLGIIRIGTNGRCAELLWGFSDGGTFTSELPAHLMGHIARRKIDTENRIILHSHPTNILAMNYVHVLNEREITRTLWKMCTECIAIFPEGIGVLPWMLCGTDEIGAATAEKFLQYRIVIWAMHGIYAAGKTLNEAFGLIETVEKAAQIYMLTAHLPRMNTISDESLLLMAETWKKNYRKDFFE